MPSSPYVVGQWVRGEKFYGRASLIEEVLEGHRNWLWLLGTRRVGKTSLLKQLELIASTSSPPAYFPVFWDFQGAEDPDELYAGFRDALLDAEERLEGLGIDPATLEGSDLFDSLGRLRRRLRAGNLKLLLLCDEVEELIKLNRKDPALLRKLRRAMQSQEDIRSVLASTIRLWALAEQGGDTSPFLHGFTPPLYIHGLSHDEARALIRQNKMPDRSQPPIEADKVEDIRVKCDNHPYLIQLVCRRFLEVGNLEEAVEQVATDQMVSYFFAVDFEMLTQSEKDIIRIIAEGSSASSDSILDRLTVQPGELSGLLLRLEHLGYLRRNRDGRFELVNHFFRKWFGEQPHSRPPNVSGPERPSLARPNSERTTQVGGPPSLFDDRYELMGVVGRGAVGVVYRARDVELDETVALKILKPEYAANAEILERFHREILLARDIGHPNIVKVYHLGDSGGQKYLLMRLVEGQTLARLMARDGPFQTSGAVRTALKLASALEAVHAQDVIHRDIKPGNILIDGAGEPYLTDFGLARRGRSPGMTQEGVFLGTPDYASPEQARLLPCDERSDIYSLGVVLYEMVTGMKPFTADSGGAVLEMHRSRTPRDPRALRPTIPAALSHLILRCLEKEPGRRHQTALALGRALEGVAAS